MRGTSGRGAQGLQTRAGSMFAGRARVTGCELRLNSIAEPSAALQPNHSNQRAQRELGLVSARCAGGGARQRARRAPEHRLSRCCRWRRIPASRAVTAPHTLEGQVQLVIEGVAGAATLASGPHMPQGTLLAAPSEPRRAAITHSPGQHAQPRGGSGSPTSCSLAGRPCTSCHQTALAAPTTLPCPPSRPLSHSPASLQSDGQACTPPVGSALCAAAAAGSGRGRRGCCGAGGRATPAAAASGR